MLFSSISAHPVRDMVFAILQDDRLTNEVCTSPDLIAVLNYLVEASHGDNMAPITGRLINHAFGGISDDVTLLFKDVGFGFFFFSGR